MAKRFDLSRNSTSLMNVMPGPGDYEVGHHKSIDASIRQATYALGFY